MPLPKTLAFYMKISEYNEIYKSDCLNIFDSNIPKYFSPEERALFENFLQVEAKINPYFVVELNNTIVGCGGYEISGSEAGLTWGMVSSRCHNMQIGTELLRYRLKEIQVQPKLLMVNIDTSQHAEGFFKKFGFVITNTVKNGYGVGLHKIYMRLKLQS